jgi:hypothetical protein
MFSKRTFVDGYYYWDYKFMTPEQKAHENRIIIKVVSSTTDAQYGFCGNGCSIANVPSLPAEISHIITAEEMNQMINEINPILASTHIAGCPMVFMHFLLPCSPICIAKSYRRDREKQVTEVLRRWNENVFSKRGIHWEITPFLEAESGSAMDSITSRGLPLLYLMKDTD